MDIIGRSDMLITSGVEGLRSEDVERLACKTRDQKVHT